MTEETKQYILERLGKIPQAELSRITGVSQTAISLLKKRLAAKSVVQTDPRAVKRGGRRKWA